MSYDHGRFVWFELITGDAEAAKRFYAEVMGWKLQDVDMGPAGTYTMFAASDAPVGGIAMQPPAGAPPHWASYLSVEDVDAAAKKVEAAGGTLLAEAFDIPTVGRMQPVTDSTGAAFLLFHGETDDQAAASGAGAFHWNELSTDDPEKAKRFYEQAFGYTVEVTDMPQGKYYLLKNGDQMRGGLMKKPHDGPNAWVQYVTVDDVDAAVARTTAQGGATLMPPLDVEGVGRFAVVGDPAGAAIGLIKPAS